MPSKSQAQNRLMHAVEEDPELAKEKGIPQSVAREYVKADHGRKVGKLPEHVKPKRKAKAKRRGSVPGFPKRG